MCVDSWGISKNNDNLAQPFNFCFCAFHFIFGLAPKVPPRASFRVKVGRTDAENRVTRTCGQKVPNKCNITAQNKQK